MRWIIATWLLVLLSACSTTERLPECRGPWVPLDPIDGGAGHG